LRPLVSLARTNRRFSEIVGPVLYSTGVKDFGHLPLAWAAKKGVAGTLQKALDAGADPNWVLSHKTSEATLLEAHAFSDSAAAWDSKDPGYWPMGQRYRSQEEEEEEEEEEDDDDDGMDDDDDMDDMDELDFFPWDDDMDHSEEDEDQDEGAIVLRRYTALHIAAKEGHDDIIDILLDHHANVESNSVFFCNCPPQTSVWHSLEDPHFNLNGPPRWTPLHVAICSHRLKTAKLLISRGAKIQSHEDHPDFPPIHQAAAKGHVELLSYMLEQNRDVGIDCKDDWGLTPLYYATTNRKWESTVPFLLSRGADINLQIHFEVERSIMSTTMLAEACRFARFDDAQKLLEVGASADCDLTIRPASRRFSLSVYATTIPLLHLCCMQPPSMLLPLEGPYKDPLAFPSLGQEGMAHPFITSLVAQGALDRWEYDHDDQRSALSVAAVHLNTNALQALLDAGTDVNTCDTKQRNALMNLLGEPPWRPDTNALSGHWRNDHQNSLDKLLLTVAQALLNAGLQVNHQDRNGKTVLHLFFEGFRTRSLPIETNTAGDILRLLLSEGADPCLKDRSGFTALHSAIHDRLLWATSILTRDSKISLKELFDHQGLIDALDRVVAGQNFFLVGSSIDSHPGVPRSQIREFIDLILDMDYEGHFLSDERFFHHYLAGVAPASSPAHLVEVICLRTLPYITKCLQPESILALARLAISKQCYRVALNLVQRLSRSVIDEPDGDGETILFQAMTCCLQRETGIEIFDYHKLLMELLRRGANLHRPISTKKQYDNVKGPTTPLMLAITYPVKGWDSVIQSMLSVQPIKGNPQASSQLYLHQALSPEVLRTIGPESTFNPITGAFPYSMLVRALLQYGADTGQLDEDGNTPLSFFVEQQLKHMKGTNIDTYLYQFVLPLSLGVDLGLKNCRGKSGVDLL
ncbi:ankyrin repeat-containing domain protein, partial [Cladorrhinum sp. PSN332]